MQLQTRAAAAVLLTLALTAAGAQEHANVRHAPNLAPSADLAYSIKARQHGIPIGGDASVAWRAADGKYSIVAETRATLLGKILENRSEGAIDVHGLAPLSFYDKRLRKEPSTTSFNRAGKTITFSTSSQSYPIHGGEQDRTSVSWQLLALARGAPDKFVPGSEWSFMVAGQRDAEPWSFKVVGQEVVHAGVGEVTAVHLVKAPPPDSKDQQLDIWLAPSLEWYPVRLRFNDDNGDFVDQTLDKITRR